MLLAGILLTLAATITVGLALRLALRLTLCPFASCCVVVCSRPLCCRDVVYACLRDLGVEYAETMTGKAQAERAARAIATGNIAVK